MSLAPSAAAAEEADASPLAAPEAQAVPLSRYASEPPSPLQEARDLPADRLLVLLGGAGSVLFGMLSFVLAMSEGRAFSPQGPFGSGGQVMALAVALTFGILLLHALSTMTRRPTEGATLALAFGIVLVIFGGAGGMLGGVLAIGGAGLALARHIQWR